MGIGFLALLKDLHKEGYSAMTLALAAIVMVSWMQWIDAPKAEARITGVEDSLKAIQASALEERLDQAYAALCENRGDPALLERIRELQQQYAEVTGGRYPQPSCDLLQKLK